MAAEKAYGKVLERSRGSSLRTADDFANLSRVLLDRGDTEASRKVVADMRRELRGDKQAELAALVTESLCLHAEGAGEKAKALVDQALALQQTIAAEAAEKGRHASQRLAVDLAHACYATGKEDAAGRIMRQVAAENHEDTHLIDHITNVFAKTGQPDAGKALLDQVGKEIVELNNKGVMAARSGDLEGAVKLLTQAAEQVALGNGDLTTRNRRSAEGLEGVVGSVLGLITGAAGDGGFKGLAGRHVRRDLLRYGVAMAGELRVTRLDNGAAVELAHHTQAVPRPPGLTELMREALAPQAGSAAREAFAAAWQGWVRTMLIAHADDPALITIVA